MSAVRIELDVELTCNSCVEAVKRQFENLDSIQDLSIDLEKQQITLTTSLPSSQIVDAIEKTGRKAIIKGYGSSGKSLNAAVAALHGQTNIYGVVRFVNINENICLADGTVDGLHPGIYNVNIHEYGDISQGIVSMGEFYNPEMKETDKVAGNLGVVKCDISGTAVFRFESQNIQVSDIIGRSVSICSDGNSETCLAYGIIARSAGLFENPKRICLCSGKTVWEERQSSPHSKM